jgi:phenylacetate-CoA ligase
LNSTQLWWKMLKLAGRGDIARWYGFFSESQYWPVEELNAFVNRRLTTILKDALTHVPYYRSRFGEMAKGITEETVRDVLRQIPVIDKTAIRRNYDEFLREPLPRRIRTNRTGGTTGEPFQYHSTWRTWAITWAANYRVWSFAGFQPGDRWATLAAYSLTGKRTPLVSDVRSRLEGNLTLPSTHLDEKIVAGHIQAIEKHRARFLRGYPSALDRVARYLLENPRKGAVLRDRLKAVITTSEVLVPEVRSRIEEAFGVRVFNEYGCRDGGVMSGECGHGTGLHFSIDRAYLEFDSGGRVVVTDLWQDALPFIRYVPGDLSAFADETECPCGRSLPLISGVQGRDMDVLRFDNGISISSPALTVIAGQLPILEYQIVQDERNHVTVSLVPDATGTATGSHWDTFRETLLYHFGPGVTVDLKLVDEIQRTRAGKLRFVINQTAEQVGAAEGSRGS